MNELPSDPKVILAMDPEALVLLLHEQITFPEITRIDDRAGREEAAAALSKAAAYVCYFKEMEALVKVRKRSARRDGTAAGEVSRLLGLEDVFEAFKRISEQQYEYVSKLMTLKRLEIDEAKLIGRQEP